MHLLKALDAFNVSFIQNRVKIDHVGAIEKKETERDVMPRV